MLLILKEMSANEARDPLPTLDERSEDQIPGYDQDGVHDSGCSRDD